MKKFLYYKVKKPLSLLLQNNDAVLGLPMRLTVSVIIGSVALVAILAYILNPCLFPGKMIVSVSPLVNNISGGNTFNVTVNVTDTNGASISGASVIVKGLGGAGSNSTNVYGSCLVQITVQLENGTIEGYLDVVVKAVCHETFSQNDLIKVVDVK